MAPCELNLVWRCVLPVTQRFKQYKLWAIDRRQVTTNLCLNTSLPCHKNERLCRWGHYRHLVATWPGLAKDGPVAPTKNKKRSYHLYLSTSGLCFTNAAIPTHDLLQKPSVGLFKVKRTPSGFETISSRHHTFILSLTILGRLYPCTVNLKQTL